MIQARLTARPVLSLPALGGAVGIALGLGLFFIPVLAIPDQPRHALAITAFAATFWLTLPIRPEFTSLIALSLFAFTGTVPFEIAFSGFATRAMWLIIAGMIIGLGVIESNLGKRIAYLAIDRFGSSYWRLLVGLTCAGFVLTFFIPSSMVRILLLAPLTVTLIEALHLPKGSAAAAGVFLAPGLGTYYTSAGILTANTPNIVLLDVLEKANLTVYWAEWALRHFPIAGLGGLLLILTFLRLFYGRAAVAKPAGFTATGHDLGPISPTEIRMLGLLLLGIALWSTDTFHHIHPTYVAMLIALLVFMPRYGVLDFGMVSKLNFTMLFFLGGVFAIGGIMQQSGFVAWASERLLTVLPGPGSGSFSILFAISLVSEAFALLMDTAAEASMITPILLDYTRTVGMDPISAGLIIALPFCFPYFPYQATPVMVLASFGYVRPGHVIRMTVLLAVIALFVLVPLTILYWKLLGLVP